MTPIIRPAEQTDLDTLCDLYLEFHEFHTRHLPAYLRSLGESSEQERLKLGLEIMQILDGRDSDILVAEVSGRLIGFAEVHLKLPDDKDHAKTHTSYVHLQSLSVTESFRHKNIGTLVLKTAESWVRQHGAAELRLDIWEFPDGPLGFYRKAGYRTFRRALVKNL